MSDQPTVKMLTGDYCEMVCVCGTEHTLVFDGGDTEPCEGCGRVWTLSSRVVMVSGPNQGSPEEEQ